MKKGSAFSRDVPFNDLPALPPICELNTPAVLKKTIGASRKLAELKGILNALPNPHLLLDTLQLREAKASSEIENIITTNDDLYRFVVSEARAAYGASKEDYGYKEALWLGFNRLAERPFITTNLCTEIVQCIKKNDAGIRKNIGTVLSSSSGDVIYIPPTGEDVIREKMNQLEKFINENQELDPLIKMALAHYQFEAIHPFADGNGRTGRILMLLQLKLEDLLPIPVLFLSEYIIRNKQAYYEKLMAVTEKGEWESFVLYILDMVEETAGNALSLINEIFECMDRFSTRFKEVLPKIYSKAIVEEFFKLPYSKRMNLVRMGLGTPKTVSGYLKQMEEAGLLSSEKVGKEKLYLNASLMHVLEHGGKG